MASTADAEAAAAVGGDEKPKKKGLLGKKQLMIAGAALVLVGGGAGGYFTFMKKEPPHEAAAEAPKPKAFVEIPEMIVNLAGPSERPQYLRLKIALEVADERLAKQVEPMMPRVIDAFQVHLREMRRGDLDGSAGLYRLKEELLRRINQAVYPAKVDAVLFNEVLVQ
jgi:flagellar FliL protein